MVPNSGTLNSETPSIAVPKSLGTNAPLNSGIVPLLRSAFSIAAIVPLLRTADCTGKPPLLYIVAAEPPACRTHAHSTTKTEHQHNLLTHHAMRGWRALQTCRRRTDSPQRTCLQDSEMCEVLSHLGIVPGMPTTPPAMEAVESWVELEDQEEVVKASAARALTTSSWSSSSTQDSTASIAGGVVGIPGTIPRCDSTSHISESCRHVRWGLSVLRRQVCKALQPRMA